MVGTQSVPTIFVYYLPIKRASRFCGGMLFGLLFFLCFVGQAECLSDEGFEFVCVS